MKLMKYRPIYFAISLFFLVPGMLSLIFFGLKPSIDFTGGSLLEVAFRTDQLPFELKQSSVQEIVGDTYEISSVQVSGENQIIIRGKTIDNEQKNQALESFQRKFPNESQEILGDDFVKLETGEEERLVEEIRFETVGPTLGTELLYKMMTAVFIVAMLITLYVWKQFSELKYGVCAILAMFHDTFILLGAFSILGHFWGVEVDVLFVTALLTTLSFSVHDTIVVYDRIRELKRKHSRATLEDVSNAAVLETLGRSINNSLTIIIMLLSLVLLGGSSIRWFSVALLVGAIAGTYSSTFTAVPLVLVWDKYVAKKS